MKWMRVRMSQWWNGCTFCERNKAFSASSSRMRELCLATWAFSDATSEVVVDWYRGRQQERKKKQRTYSRRSMARRQRWRSVATGRQRRQAWISFSSPRRDARGDEIGEIDSRVAKRILYEFESEFVNFVVRKVTRGALSGSIGACGGVWGGRLVSGRREASAHSPNLIKNMGFFLDQYEFGGSGGRVVSGRKSPIQPAGSQYAQGKIWK